MTRPGDPITPSSPLGDVDVELIGRAAGWRLRSLHEADAALLRAASEPDREHLAARLPWPARAGDDDGAAAWLVEHARGVNGRIAALGVVDASGQLHGGVNLLRYDATHGSVEMGVWAIRAAEGKGLISAACRASLGVLRSRLDVQRVVWRCEPDNHRSLLLAERLGFRLEGRLREVQARPDGSRYDLLMLSLVAEEIDQAAQTPPSPSARRLGGLRVRTAASRDGDAIARLYQQLHPRDAPVAPDQWKRTFDQILASPGLDLLVLELDNNVVATSYLNVIANLTRAARPYAVIENVVVDAVHRGQGLGRALMSATLDRAWQADCYKAMLLTGSRDPATHAYYRACGFDEGAKTAYLARPQK